MHSPTMIAGRVFQRLSLQELYSKQLEYNPCVQEYVLVNFTSIAKSMKWAIARTH